MNVSDCLFPGLCTQKEDKMRLDVIEGIAIPFIGTTLGSACVFFMRKELSRTVQRALTGFAGGVMVARKNRIIDMVEALKSAE